MQNYLFFISLFSCQCLQNQRSIFYPSLPNSSFLSYASTKLDKLEILLYSLLSHRRVTGRCCSTPRACDIGPVKIRYLISTSCNDHEPLLQFFPVRVLLRIVSLVQSENDKLLQQRRPRNSIPNVTSGHILVMANAGERTRSPQCQAMIGRYPRRLIATSHWSMDVESNQSSESEGNSFVKDGNSPSNPRSVWRIYEEGRASQGPSAGFDMGHPPVELRCSLCRMQKTI